MIKLTVPEFSEMRDGLAAAHLFNEAIGPVLRRRRGALSRNQRALFDDVPDRVEKALQLALRLTAREQGGNPQAQPIAAVTLKDIDIPTMREELENIAALTMPDVENSLRAALTDLDGLADVMQQITDPYQLGARLMAIAWEAGRRYAFQQAIAIFEDTTADYSKGTLEIFDNAMNATLDLPAPENPDAPPDSGPQLVN